MRPTRRSTDPATPDPTRRRLTPREREIALLVAAGLNDAAIARRTGLAVSSTGLYIRRILQRLRLKDRTELAAWVVTRSSPTDPEGRLRRVDDAPTEPR